MMRTILGGQCWSLLPAADRQAITGRATAMIVSYVFMWNSMDLDALTVCSSSDEAVGFFYADLRAMNSGVVTVRDSSMLEAGVDAATVQVLSMKVEANPRVPQGLKRKLTLEEVIVKIVALIPPTPSRDARFFHYVCGLSNEGEEPAFSV